MKSNATLLARVLVGITVITSTSALFGQTGASSPATAPSPAMPAGTSTSAGGGAASSGMPNEAEMMKQMMEMSKLNENHKVLSSTDGTWTFVNKMWMNGDPSSK